MALVPVPSEADDPLLTETASENESHLSSLVYDMSQQVQTAMENMLKMINEIDHHSAGINEDVEKCRESALERKKGLEERRDRFQKAAFAVLDMLNPEYSKSGDSA